MIRHSIPNSRQHCAEKILKDVQCNKLVNAIANEQLRIEIRNFDLMREIMISIANSSGTRKLPKLLDRKYFYERQ